MKNEKLIKDEIRKYILEASLSDTKNIKDNTLIFEEGLLDSMGLLFLIEFLKEKFDVEVNDEELSPKNFETIESIVSFVVNKLNVNIQIS